jgi:hypothetical protein
MMLPVIISDIVTDLLHELCALAAHIQYLISCSIGSGLLTIAIIHRKTENAIGYKAVSEALNHVDAFLRQRRKRDLGVYGSRPLVIRTCSNQSSNMASIISISSTQEGSYFEPFIGVPQFGQVTYGLSA